MDRIIREKRSEIMSGIRGKWTWPERFAHKLLLDHDVVHVMHPKIPGNPDILIVGERIAIFLDGCFWHGCPRHYRPPKSNCDYWLPKIGANMKRDRRNRRRAWEAGYRTRRVWECRLSSARLLAVAGVL